MALRETRVTKADVYAKLRVANVTEPAQIHAVAGESTGDISVLHSSAGERFEDKSLAGFPTR